MKYITHAGLFHCDEVMGHTICNLAGHIDGLVRLSDLATLPQYEQEDIIADIGRVYDANNLRFDHHQDLIRRENGYPYASAGLLWKAFGMDAVAEVLGCRAEDPAVEKIVARVDLRLMQGLDAHDADSAYSVTATCSGGPVSVITLPRFVSLFNAEDVFDHKLQQENFERASAFLRGILKEEIFSANDFLRDSAEFDKHCKATSTHILVLDKAMNWKEIVHERFPQTLFVIAPSLHPGNPWSLLAVPVSPESRELKQTIERPEWFEGFIHQGKWIAGAESTEELIRLAKENI